MIRNPHIVRAFEDDLARRSPPDHLANLRLAEAMLEEARQLGAWPPANPLEGIEVDVRVARILHVCRPA
jgi:LmbE family N-acetylglucosaminyl deacetylase